MRLSIYLCISVLALPAGACGRDGDIDPPLNGESVVQITPALSGTLAVEDANGQPRATLRSDEELFLTFTLNNAGDSAILAGPPPPPNTIGQDFDIAWNQEFMLLVRLTSSSRDVGEVVGKPFAQSWYFDYASRPMLIPPRTVAVWRVPWRGAEGTIYRLPQFTPTTTLNEPRPYARFRPDPGPLLPGVYRTGFWLEVGDRRARFYVTFRVQ